MPKRKTNFTVIYHKKKIGKYKINNGLVGLCSILSQWEIGDIKKVIEAIAS